MNMYQIFNAINGWYSLAGIIIVGCLVAAYYFPVFRQTFFGIAVVVGGAIAAYSKGVRDRAALERKQRDRMVKKINKKYDNIDKADPETKRRLDDGTF